MSYLKQLKKDSKLATIIGNEKIQLPSHANIPLRLMASIMSQQLSTQVAKILYGRFIELFKGKEPKPQQVLDIPFDDLKGIGLSIGKVFYIQNVAQFCIENKITDKKLQKMSDEEIIELLTQIKGVGRWTVEMLLMFSLGREDVFAVDDLGIQQAMAKLYRLKTDDKKKLKEKMQTIAEQWKPYRTYACMYLWRWKDTAPME